MWKVWQLNIYGWKWRPHFLDRIHLDWALNNGHFPVECHTSLKHFENGERERGKGKESVKKVWRLRKDKLQKYGKRVPFLAFMLWKWKEKKMGQTLKLWPVKGTSQQWWLKKRVPVLITWNSYMECSLHVTATDFDDFYCS